MAIKVVFCNYEHISNLINDDIDYYILSKDDWDDYNYRTSFIVSIIKNKEKYEGLSRKILFKDQQEKEYSYKKFEEYRDGKSYLELQDLKTHESFISLGDDYEELKKLFPDEFENILIELNDVVYLKRNEPENKLLELEEHPAFDISLCRDQSAKKMLNEAKAILYGDVLSSNRFTFDFNFNLDDRRYKYNFNFIDNELPHRINILIGKNGAGKSQTLLALSKYFLLPEVEIEKLQIEVSDHPNFISNLMVVAYNPHEEFLVPKEDTIKLPIDYKYLGFKRYIDNKLILDINTPAILTYNSICSMYERDRDNFSHEVHLNDDSLIYLSQEYIKKAIPGFCCFALKLKGNQKQEYMNSFNFVDSEDTIFDDYMKLEFLEDSKIFPEIKFSDFDEELYYVDDQDKLLNLSSGQKIFSYLAVNTLSIIKNNSLILIDEPETALHPNLEIDFMSLLKSILDKFDSFAIIATHSAIITREVPRDFVHVIKIDDENQPVAKKPTINTFGMDIGTLTNYVFDDVFIHEKPYTQWVKDQKEKYKEFSKFEEYFNEKLGYDFLLQCRNIWETL